MSSHVFPLPPGVLSQPNLTVFPGVGAPAPPVPGIIQLATQDCGSGWRIVTSGGAAGAEGAWSFQIIFPTVNENKWFTFICNHNFSTTDRFAEFDIGVGLAGSEVPAIDDLGYSINGFLAGAGFSCGVTYTGAFDTPIPVGSSISIRVKDNIASAISYRAHLTLMGE